MKKQLSLMLVTALMVQGSGLQAMSSMNKPRQTGLARVRAGFMDKVANPVTSFLNRYIGQPGKQQIDGFIDWSSGLFDELNAARKAGTLQSQGPSILNKYRKKAGAKGVIFAIVLTVLTIVLSRMAVGGIRSLVYKTKSDLGKEVLDHAKSGDLSAQKLFLGNLMMAAQKDPSISIDFTDANKASEYVIGKPFNRVINWLILSPENRSLMDLIGISRDFQNVTEKPSMYQRLKQKLPYPFKKVEEKVENLDYELQY